VPRTVGVIAFLEIKGDDAPGVAAGLYNLEVNCRKIVHSPLPGSGERKISPTAVPRVVRQWRASCWQLELPQQGTLQVNSSCGLLLSTFAVEILRFWRRLVLRLPRSRRAPWSL